MSTHTFTPSVLRAAGGRHFPAVRQNMTAQKDDWEKWNLIITKKLFFKK